VSMVKEIAKKKTGSTPKLLFWKPCDRLRKKQRPVAPIREPVRTPTSAENVAVFQNRRRAKANLLVVELVVSGRFPVACCSSVQFLPVVVVFGPSGQLPAIVSSGQPTVNQGGHQNICVFGGVCFFWEPRSAWLT